MKKKWIWVLIAAVLVIAGVVTAVVLLRDGGSGNHGGTLVQGDTASVTDGNWVLTNEWNVERADSGEETLTVSAYEDSTAWNTFFKLYQEWTVSVDLTLNERNGETDCLRLAFGDQFQNVCVVVSVEYHDTQVLLKADALSYIGWKTVYTADDWADFDAGQPLTLSVKRVSGAEKLAVSLAQGDTVLAEGTTRTLSDEVLDMIERTALSAYGSVGTFTNFGVQAARQQVDLSQVTEGVIEADENVPTDDWLLGEGAVHNLLKGESAIIIDGEGEKLAWNAAQELGDEWALSCYVEFGKSYRDSVCARFILGAHAELPGNVAGLITVNYTNNQVNLEVQNKEGDGWVTTANSMGWQNVSGRHIRVVIAKYAEINRLAIFLYDDERLAYATFTDEMTENQMEKFKHYGVMVYSSQVRFSEFELSDKPDDSIMPAMSERDYPQVSDLTVPEGESTSDWALSKNTTFFHENGEEAMIIDSKGEEFTYYTAHTMDGEWSVSTRVDFGTYYSDTAGIRFYFGTANKDFAALLTIKYSLDGGALLNCNLQTYVPETDGWNDAVKINWQKGDSTFYIELSGGKADGTMYISVYGANTGEVVFDETVTLEADTLSRMQVIGFGTIAAQSKYSEIKMNLTGGAVEMSGTTDPSDKTMYELTYGAASASDRWQTENGVIYTAGNEIVADASEGAYAFDVANTIVDGFTVSTDILFGKMDSNGVCTSRIALVDDSHGMIGLFSIKFSENFEVMVEGQYNDNGAWVDAITDNAWREVQDNRVRVTLSRPEGTDSYALSISDFGGKNVFYGALTMPTRVSVKITNYALGADRSSAKFSNMYCELSGKTENEPTLEDYGMIGIDAGDPAETTRWILQEGASWRNDDALLVEGAQVFAKDAELRVSNGFSVTADVQFGSLDSDGTCTARVGLLDASGSKVGIFTFKFSENFEMMVQGEYDAGSGWVGCITDNNWRKVQDNRLHVVVEREDDSTAITLRIYDFSGNQVFEETCAVPYAVASGIAGYELGVDNSTVKYTYIFSYASDTVLPPQTMQPITENGEAVAASDWTATDGVKEYADGSVIVRSSGADVFTYRNGVTLEDNFSFAGKLQFGEPDGEGVSTARIVLTDDGKNTVGLFTVKFSENFEVMAQGEYFADGAWNTVLSDTGWKSVEDNTVAVKLVRQTGGSYLLTVENSSGVTVLTAVAASMPEDVAAKISGIGVGALNTQVKFSEIAIDAKPEDTQKPTIVDGEESIVIGTVIVPDGWTNDSGVTHTSEGNIITMGSGDVFSYNTSDALTDAFTLKTDLVFGTKGGDGTCTARIVLGNAEHNPVGLFTLKYDSEKKLLLEGQYYLDGSWTTVLAMDWTEVGTNHLSVTLKKAAGADTLTLHVEKQDGTVVFDGAAQMPAEAFAAMACYGFGSNNSQVQFSKITYQAS